MSHRSRPPVPTSCSRRAVSGGGTRSRCPLPEARFAVLDTRPRDQHLPLVSTPEVAVLQNGCFSTLWFADEGAHGSALADARTVPRGGEHGGIGRPARGPLPRLSTVTVQVVDAQYVELGEQPLAKQDQGRVAKVREVADETDDPASLHLGDAAFGYPDEADVEVVDVVSGDAPVRQALLVDVDQVALLSRTNAGVGVVGRVAEDNQDRGLLLDGVRSVALCRELRKAQLSLRLIDCPGVDPLRWTP